MGWSGYVLQFCQVHDDFKLPELDAVLQYCGVEPSEVYCRERAEESIGEGLPFLKVMLPSDEVARLVGSRMVTVTQILHMWGRGSTLDELCSSLGAELASTGALKDNLAADKSWSMEVRPVGNKRSEQEKDLMRKRILQSVKFLGPVQIKDADLPCILLEDRWLCEPPREYYFGVRVSQGARTEANAMTLRKRAYLGPTSMDSHLSMIMANMGKIGPGCLVCDPFVGTGSILVACTKLGGFCIGADIDYRILKGKEGKCLSDNFEQYNLPIPDIVRCDISMRFHQWREAEMFDAIVCDPPYGVRAGARRLPHKASDERSSQARSGQETCVPRTVVYPIEDVLVDLLDVAARALRVGGRLVYLLPSPWEYDPVKELPGHPCLDLVAHSVQGLTLTSCRRLITMEKAAAYNISLQDEYLEFARKGGQARSTGAVQRLPTGQALPAWVNRQILKGKWGSSDRYHDENSRVSQSRKPKSVRKALKYEGTLRGVEGLASS
jgi:tRNA (guanine10-N2)-methyltransferase